MKVTVVAFGAMRDYLADPASGRAALEVGEGERVADLLERLGAPDRLVHVVLVDGRRVGLDHRLDEGAEVTLMPPFSGGANQARRSDG